MRLRFVPVSILILYGLSNRRPFRSILPALKIDRHEVVMPLSGDVCAEDCGCLHLALKCFNRTADNVVGFPL